LDTVTFTPPTAVYATMGGAPGVGGENSTNYTYVITFFVRTSFIGEFYHTVFLTPIECFLRNFDDFFASPENLFVPNLNKLYCHYRTFP
jgi:hypothetical protein